MRRGSFPFLFLNLTNDTKKEKKVDNRGFLSPYLSFVVFKGVDAWAVRGVWTGGGKEDEAIMKGKASTHHPRGALFLFYLRELCKLRRGDKGGTAGQSAVSGAKRAQPEESIISSVGTRPMGGQEECVGNGHTGCGAH